MLNHLKGICLYERACFSYSVSNHVLVRSIVRSNGDQQDEPQDTQSKSV